MTGSQPHKLYFFGKRLKGHIIIYPQCPESIATILPPTVDDIITPICIIFVVWLQEKAKPLIAQREKVHNASDITINHGILDSMQEETLMPFHVNHILPNYAHECLTSRYDVEEDMHLEDSLDSSKLVHAPSESVVVTNVDGHVSVNELRAAAVYHIKNKGGGYIQIPHDPEPVSEFCHPELFPMIYPTLFLYGLGGFKDYLCSEPLSIEKHIKHLFNLHSTFYNDEKFCYILL
ncbi:hypothetical protein C8R48DRAFT_749017 [Suillus tomentosus]|nr:hypothetical protein C8R48DRAFT_749017 [Suillus tomentosus]